MNFNTQQPRLIWPKQQPPHSGRGEDGHAFIHPLSRYDMQCLPWALPWFRFFLQWWCVWNLGSLLPVKIPALSTVLELLANSSVHYRPLLLEQRKKTMKDAPLGNFSIASGGVVITAACLVLLCYFYKTRKVWQRCLSASNTFQLRDCDRLRKQ